MIAEKKLESTPISTETVLKAFRLMCTARAMSDLYEEHATFTARYVHACSRGHEAVQIALGLQLKSIDYLSAYYRDDSILLSIGMTPYELMLQLMAKRDDPFSGGRTYYSHPSLRRDDMPKIPHQSSATGMQAIPTTGIALGMHYLENQNLVEYAEGEYPVTVCSLGDACVTEGEVSEAFQMAVLKKLPILYFVQDNEWDISAHASEIRTMNAAEYAKGFKGLETRSIDGTDFFQSYNTIKEVLDIIRTERRPFLIHAKVPLLGHHTSGVRREWYRHDLEEAKKKDPLPKFIQQLEEAGFTSDELDAIKKETRTLVEDDFAKAKAADDPLPEDLFKHDYAPTTVTEEKGVRQPAGKEPTVMVDCALFAVKELLQKHPECLFYGQDVGARLGGVFREAATLAKTFGDDRVFNTPIQEAFIIGSTVGMSAVGCKPIVEVQFADYIWPGLNQLFTEVSRSCYLSNGKWPVSCVIRVPIGAYGSGGPYHSSSVETVVLNIRGVKVAYPSTGADLKGLMKAAYYDPNPVVIFEHKGLYWSKIKGTEDARTIEPDEDYIIPFGKARIVQQAEALQDENTLTVITYGMGVYWAKAAAQEFKGRIEIIDLRTLNPLDETTIFESVRKHHRCLVLTEEPLKNSFAEALSGRIQQQCFTALDAPVVAMGSENMPAIPLNSTLEFTMIPNAQKVSEQMNYLLNY
ncbi:MAG TPA: thiamine pyrophosphate-dependent enzyme [Bacteroidia bacterium]|jgi:2-oxoisovalerate dehydrogenase E1 component|nr:tungsten formylmethanofuran dehydrogenase [Bacteroidia bacterium]MBP7715534.1 tungsten formylmethanofuran dehydrogenase [Bacteroidia bacterium]MBP8669380.1 tungsten formylmethanofuran dehydrogenase [Bacteroidia bacterium]HOZ83095.1 thiamine pyrophosphate-dependent enzyme [Bacteroidia bacterium]HOZ89374.1 thiamine pyrophosphate-dependent enzyme [Bacteroidia bacterium]